jgi:arginase
MAEAAGLPLPYPEAGVIEEDSLQEQTLALASDLPDVPLVLGGCCCAHIGAVEGLAARHGRIAVVWFDAHGDLNTPKTSPSGNQWGMPLRMLLDSASLSPQDAVLIGSRNLDPPEEVFIAESGIGRGPPDIDTALEGTEGVYVALDADVLAEEEVASFMPEPGGISLAQASLLLVSLTERSTVLGVGLTGLRLDERNVQPLSRLCSALGL